MATGLADKRIRTVVKRNGRPVPFRFSKIQGAIELAMKDVERINPNLGYSIERGAKALAREAVEKLEAKNPDGKYCPGIEEIQEVVLDVIHRDAARDGDRIYPDPLMLWSGYMCHMYERHLESDRELPNGGRTSTTFHAKLRDAVETWNRDQGCDTVQGLNEWYRGTNGKHLPELIRLSEEFYLAQLMTASETVIQEMSRRTIRAIIVCGPSSSGKTTTTNILEGLIKRTHPTLVFSGMEVDGYFDSYAEYARTGRMLQYTVDGKVVYDYDYETPHAYRIALLNAHLAALMKGDEILMPKYTFGKGVYTDNQIPFRLNDGEILLIDCLHGAYPPLTEAIPPEQKLVLFIEQMNVIRNAKGHLIPYTDGRMMRRMLRDREGRGHPIDATAYHWHLVRKGDIAFLLPYSSRADIVVNGGMAYELPMLKHFLDEDLRELHPVFKRNPDLYDGKERIRRVLELYKQLETATLEQISHVPSSSVLREFIYNAGLE